MSVDAIQEHSGVPNATRAAENDESMASELLCP